MRTTEGTGERVLVQWRLIETKERADREEQTGTGREKSRSTSWNKLCAAMSAESHWMDLTRNI